MEVEPSGSFSTAGRTNRVMAWLLQSRAQRLVSRWFCLVRYEGRKSGRRYCTPTQYVRNESGILILVGRSNTKTWWRNFCDPAGHPIEVLIAGEWLTLRGHAVVGAEDPVKAERLLRDYVERYPKARRAVAGTTDAERAQAAVLVHCTTTGLAT